MKRIAAIFGIVVVLLLAIVIAIPLLINANEFRPALESRLSEALGREVKVGDLKISLFSGSVSASDLSIADDPAFSKTAFLGAQSLQAGAEMIPLILSHKLQVTSITIDKPQINLIETPAGVFNFSGIGAKSSSGRAPAPEAQTGKTPDLTVGVLKITGGRIVLEKAGSKTKPLTLDALNVEVKNFAADAQFPFSLSANVTGGGTIELAGTAGPINAGETANTPFNAKLRVTHLDLAGSGLVDPATGLAGIASIDGSAQSANGIINVSGKLNAERLILSRGGGPARRPAEVDLEISHNLARQSGDVRRMAIHLGSARAEISGTYNLATEPATVHLKLLGSKMPLTELAAFLPALNIALPAGASIDQGTADVNLSSDGSLDRLVTQGAMGTENARLANYDFASKLQILHEFTGIKAQPHTLIETLRASVRNTRDGTALDNLQFTVASIGTITGAGSISAAHALDFKMRAVPGGALASSRTQVGIPFAIQGTAENPSIRPDVKGIVSETIKDFTSGKSPADAAKGLLNGLFGGKRKQQ
ncbi:MAG: AsmA family protein [Acidobacteriia bacterium]|nr:AsmA family protein [Terriglobia bacterium]